jgi:hypothetical protein
MRTGAFLLACAIALPAPALAWDYPGHRIVGAIADAVLSANEPEIYKKIVGTPFQAGILSGHDTDGNLLQRSLRDVAVYPDCAKFGNVPWCGRTPTKEEVAYVARNPHNGSYHFTDVPLQQPKYVAGNPGTEKTDVVVMINYTVAQLRGKKPQLEGVNLTNVEALWLLAHLVGDIHQPLHVGSAYYDKTNCTTQVDPTTLPGGLSSVAAVNGGNYVLLASAIPPAAPPSDNLHLYWDTSVVNHAMRDAGFLGSEQEFARHLASEAPTLPPTGLDPETWAADWASEVIATASDAYNRSDIEITGQLKGTRCEWHAVVRPSYQAWAQGVAYDQLRKAGFRLAALLIAIYK